MLLSPQAGHVILQQESVKQFWFWISVPIIPYHWPWLKGLMDLKSKTQGILLRPYLLVKRTYIGTLFFLGPFFLYSCQSGLQMLEKLLPFQKWPCWLRNPHSWSQEKKTRSAKNLAQVCHQICFISKHNLWQKITCLPHTFPPQAAVHTQSCSLPQCQPAGSRCPPFLPPWNTFLNDCLGDGPGPDSAPGWAVCEVLGFPLPLPACGPPSSLFPVDLWLCNEGYGAGIPVETMTPAFHL